MDRRTLRPLGRDFAEDASLHVLWTIGQVVGRYSQARWSEGLLTYSRGMYNVKELHETGALGRQIAQGHWSASVSRQLQAGMELVAQMRGPTVRIKVVEARERSRSPPRCLTLAPASTLHPGAWTSFESAPSQEAAVRPQKRAASVSSFDYAPTSGHRASAAPTELDQSQATAVRPQKRAAIVSSFEYAPASAYRASATPTELDQSQETAVRHQKRAASVSSFAYAPTSAYRASAAPTELDTLADPAGYSQTSQPGIVQSPRDAVEPDFIGLVKTWKEDRNWGFVMASGRPDIFIRGGDRVLHAGTRLNRSLQDQVSNPWPVPTGRIAGDLGDPFPDGKPRAGRWWVLGAEESIAGSEAGDPFPDGRPRARRGWVLGAEESDAGSETSWLPRSSSAHSLQMRGFIGAGRIIGAASAGAMADPAHPNRAMAAALNIAQSETLATTLRQLQAHTTRRK